MTQLEVVDCFAKSIAPLWSDWAVSEAEMQQWLVALRWYDRKVVEQAVGEYYGSPENMGRTPRLAKVSRRCARLQAEKFPPQPIEYWCAFALQSHDNPVNVQGIYVKGNTSRQIIEKVAEDKRLQYAQSYGGLWDIHYFEVNDSEKQLHDLIYAGWRARKEMEEERQAIENETTL